MNEQEQLYAEVELIKDEQLKVFTMAGLAITPNAFWHLPASKTGKYHPEQSLGEAGLVRHVLATIYFAKELYTCYNCTKHEKDIILSACILHDIGKAMYEPHDIVAATALRYMYKGDYQPVFAAIYAVRWHNGKWSTGATDCERSERGEVAFPDSFTRTSQVVHIADYISSRKRVRLDP